jgi:translation initiation factor 1 (eIF-1/SUI1)
MSDVIYSTEWSSQQKKAAGKQVSGNPRKTVPVPVEPARNLPNDGVVRVGRETQGRKGGGVTVVTGVPLEGDALIAYAKELMTELAKKGWKVKRVGG